MINFRFSKKLYFCQHQPHKTNKESKSSLSFPSTRHPRVHDPMRSQHHTNQSHPHNLEVNRMGTHSWEGKQFVVSFCHLFFKSSPKNPFCPLQKNKNKNDHFQSLQSSTHIANPSQEGGRKKGERTGKDPMLTKETFFLIALFIPVPQKHLHSLTPLAVKITHSTPSTPILPFFTGRWGE